MMLFLVIYLSTLVSADVYLHNPRGSNDRNCERNVNRNNGNLMFDSQNNAKGGYACPRAVAGSNAPNAITPKMQFEVGSLLEVEWTAQHGCGLQKETINNLEPNLGTAMSPDDLKASKAQVPNVHCEIVVEMMCTGTTDPQQNYKSTANAEIAKLVAAPREGVPNNDNDAATNRINTNDPGQADATNTNNARFGLHETPQYYNECNRVQRNRGLFTADQNVNRRSAIGTRQNPNGGRRGLECPEERDYYPYWRPTPFLGVAYLVDDPSRCGGGALPCGGAGGKVCGDAANALKGDWVGNAQGYPLSANAQVMHGLCVVGEANTVPTSTNGLSNTRVNIKSRNQNRSPRELYQRREWPNNQADCLDIKAAQAAIEWKPMMFTPSMIGAEATHQNLIQAAKDGPVCDTLDYSRSNHLGNAGGADKATRFTMTIPNVNKNDAVRKAGNGADDKTVLPGEPCIVRVRYNMSSTDYNRSLDASQNGNDSPIKQDPLVKVGAADSDVVALALNTNQVARTFQDRSYVFYVKPAAAGRAAQQVVNVNVRGKRGNIVQTYPAVEYDIIPNEIGAVVCEPTDANCKTTVLAMQFVGSDYNPRRGCNDGEGGPYTGDNNVYTRVKNNANTQGSNQNSRTDRMTLLSMNDQRVNYPKVSGAGVDLGIFENKEQALKFAQAGAKEQLAKIGRQCLTANQINNINNENQRENHPRNCAEGNALSPYFATEEIVAKADWKGKTHSLYSARNNNFSNRDSKFLIMTTGPPSGATPGVSTVTPPGITLAGFVVEAEEEKYDPETGSYSSEADIDKDLDVDIPGFDPVENDDYGEGAKSGCTQDLMYFDAARSGQQVSFATVGVLSLLYLLY